MVFAGQETAIMAKTIGIELGTTNSVVAVMDGGEAKVIPMNWCRSGQRKANDGVIGSERRVTQFGAAYRDACILPKR
jgi:molecular chaperone DnaK (HSP70)